jgi:hypothetical protein
MKTVHEGTCEICINICGKALQGKKYKMKIMVV